MAITISGENNNDKILASDGVIDQISGINIVGLITASHINVGSNIQLGNAGIITATTFIGNVTGNVNSTSPLLLQTGGSERFRITGNNELGIAGANYGSSGQVLTSGGSGSAVSWTTPAAQTTIVNYADNKLVTATASGTSLNAEANLTYDGTNLQLITDANNEGIKLNSTASGGSSYPVLEMDANRSAGNTLGKIISKWNGTEVASIQITSGADSTNKDDAHMYFNTASAGTAIERLRINSSGNARIGGSSDTSDQGYRLTLQGSSNATYLQFFDNGTGTTHGSDGSYVGLINQDFYVWNREDKDIVFGTNNGIALKITDSRNIEMTGQNNSAMIHMDTSDGSDSKRLLLAGGGGSSTTRGANIALFGNEYSGSEGQLEISAGNSGNTNGFMRFFTGGSERLRITSDGRVGIGEDDPESNHVLIRGSSTVKTKSGHIMLTGDSATVNEGPQIVFSESGSGNSYAGAYIGFERKGDNSQGDLIFGTRESAGNANTVPTERVRLTSTGQFEVKSDLGIFVKSSSDNAGAQIRFSTATQSAYDQIGHIKYYHGDNFIVSGYGEGFIVGGTETNGFILRLDGALNIKDSDSAGGDGAKLLFGTDKDMRMYHSGGDGFLDGTGVGGLRVRYNDIIFSNYTNSGTRRVRFYGDEGIEIYTVTNAAGGSTGGAVIKMSDASDFSQFGKIRYVHSNNSVVNDGTDECFVVEGSETQTALKLDGRFYMSDDKFVMKKNFGNFDKIPTSGTSDGTNHQGVMMRCDNGQSSSGNSGIMSNNAYEPLILNRTGSDGTVIRIRHLGNTEGEVSVSGSTVSYGNFMGSHKAQFVDHSKPDLLIGTVMEAVNEIATWKYASFSVGVGTDATTKFIPYYGSKNDGETDTITFESNTYNATIKNHRDPMPEITKHVCVKVSDTVGSKAVFGVFNCWQEENVVERESSNTEYAWNDLDVASIGNYFIRMQSGQTPEVGDYVESAGDGTAKVQSDDILRSKTIAKITSTIKQKTYDDGSFLVTCTLHCG